MRPPIAHSAGALLLAILLGFPGCGQQPSPAVAPVPPYETVIRVAEAKLARDPGLYPVWAELGSALLERARARASWDDVVEAERALTKSLALQESQEALRGMATLRLHQHRFREAADSARRALDAWPQDGDARAVLGDALLALGKPDEARAAYESAPGGDPDFHMLAGRARCRFATGDARGAKEDLALAEERLMKEPEGPRREHALAWTHLMLGSFHFAQGEREEALAEYERALALEPGSIDVREHRAEWEARYGDPSDADRRYAQILAEVRRPDLMAAWGEVLLRMPGRESEGRERLAEAERLWRAELAAGDMGVRRALARHLLDHGGDPEEALALAVADLESRQDEAAYALKAEAEARSRTRSSR